MIFDHLSPSQFEGFTYDLLEELGFVNLSWRRGTGRPGGSAADQGRDIEGNLRERDLDDAERLDTWFVQCKHYERGVPPEQLQSGITWATAERPAVLLFVVSNFLSNPAKNWLDDYERNSHPPFRIKVWERKVLEKLLTTRPRLVAAYDLEIEDHPRDVHPAHLQYVLRPFSNSLGFFFETIDSLGAAMRDEIFEFAYYFVINPRFADRRTNGETLAESMVDEVNYDAFRQRCHEVAHLGVAELFIVQAILYHTLRWAWTIGSESALAANQAKHNIVVERLRIELREEEDDERRAKLTRMMELEERLMSGAPERQQTWSRHYTLLCEDLLPVLQREGVLWLESMRDSALLARDWREPD